MAFIYAFFISFVMQFLVIHQMGANSATVGVQGVDSSVLKNYMDAYGSTYRTFKHGALHGFMAGLFFALPVIGVGSLYERRSWKYVLVRRWLLGSNLYAYGWYYLCYDVKF